MKLRTVGKIQIGIAIFFFVAVLIVNIIAYSIAVQQGEPIMRRMMDLPNIFQDKNITEDTKTILYGTAFNGVYAMGGFAVLFAEILIASDIIILILISMLIIDGAALLSKD